MHGLDRFVARKKIVERLEAMGLLDKIEPHTNMVPHGDRSDAVIEPYLTDQWYVDAKTLAKPALAAVRAGKTELRAEELGKDLLRLDGKHPAVVHLAPTVVGPSDSGVVRTRRQGIRRRDGGRGRRRTALAYYAEHREVITVMQGSTTWLLDPDKRRRHFLLRDEDVLDTWFSSALWPFSTLGWPDETPELKRFYPTNVLVTGFDIIFFWVARMMMMGLHFMKEVPFPTVYIHALVRDEKGAKMSKSKGNVIDPLGIIDDLRRRRAALHARADGGAGPRHQAVAGARRGRAQFRDQAVERDALCRDERLRARRKLRSEIRQGNAQPLDRARDRAHRARGHGGAGGLSLQRGGRRGARLRLERVLRLVSRTGQAGADRSGRRGQVRDAGDGRVGAR